MVGLRGSSHVNSSPASSENGSNMVELTTVDSCCTSSSSSSSSSSGGGGGGGRSSPVTWAAGESDKEAKGRPSFDKLTPPVTPPLSVDSFHSDVGRGSRFSSDRSRSSSCSGTSSVGRKRQRDRALGRDSRLSDDLADDLPDDFDDDGGGGGGDDDDDDINDERYRGSHPASSTTLRFNHRRAPSYFALYESSSSDDSLHGEGRKPRSPPPSSRSSRKLLPRASKKHSSAPGGGRGCCCKRRRRRCFTRCMLVFAVCLAVAHWSFKIVWWFLWQARCTEGCYDAAAGKAGSRGPEQVHIAYGGVDADGNPTGMTVVWTTAAGEAPPVVEYGLSSDELSLRAHGTTVRYLDTVHHRAPLHDLAPGTRYFYRCGNPASSSSGDVAGSASGVDGAETASEGFPILDLSARGGRDVPVDLDGASGGGGLGTGDSDARADVDTDGRVDAAGSSSASTTVMTGSGGLRGGRGGGGGGVDASMGRLEAAGEWSGVSSFVTPPEAERWAGDGPWDRPVSVAVVGDMGLVNAGATFDRLHQLVEDDEIDFVLHLGDIGYADDAFLERPWSFGYEDKWDAFMRRASHVFAAKVPYMVVPGNHEAECHSPSCLSSPRRLNALGNFAAYNARFQMPSVESGADHGASMWYSFNVGPVHFVVIDTETDFPGSSGDHLNWVGFESGNGGFGDQIAWLKQDLAEANQERDVRPWIVVSGHRPMYSTEKADSEGLTSSGHSNRIRKAFEPIFDENKVDVYMSGHVHAFERSLPVLDNVPFVHGRGDGGDEDGDDNAAPLPSSKMVYENPVAPVHIVNGAGGCIEGFTVPVPVYPAPLPKWRAVAMNMVPGVGILTFPSKAEMHSTFVTSDSPVEVLDELTIRHQRSPTV